MTVISSPRLVRADILDAAEKYIFAGVFLFFAWRMIHAFADTGAWVTLLYFFDQLAVLAFILLRRPPKELSLRLGDWVAGLAGTLLAVLISPPSGEALVPNGVIFTLMMVGFAIHVSAKLVLRRSFGVVAANRGVKASGPYRIVRHPMYLGYVISQVGVLLAGPTTANVLIVLACWALYVWRIIAEERVLSRDAAYRDLQTTTRWRLIPGVF